jgi:hypothetical protein
MPKKKKHDVLQIGRKANKIPEYYYINYTTSALRVIAWMLLGLGFVGSLFWGITRGGSEGGLWIILGIIGSFLAWLVLITTRELLKLFMDVKENTKSTAERITKESS